MNKRFIRVIAFFLLLIFWTNFIYPINFVYANSFEDAKRSNTKKEEQGIFPSSDFIEHQLFSGMSKLKQDRSPEPISPGESMLMLIPNIFITIAKVFAIVLDLFMGSFTTKRLTAYPGTDMTDFMNDPKYINNFTLDKLFFGDIDHLNANFFKFNANATDLNTLIKINVAKWNIIVTGIALILLLRSNDLFSH